MIYITMVMYLWLSGDVDGVAEIFSWDICPQEFGRCRGARFPLRQFTGEIVGLAESIVPTGV